MEAGEDISIHAPLARRDLARLFLVPPIVQFQSTRLLRGATFHLADVDVDSGISIHAPLARRDFCECSCRPAFYISIHAPLARRDIMIFSSCLLACAFQSTRLLRGATCTKSINCRFFTGISIHAPLARRDRGQNDMTCSCSISIHAPLARRDDVMADSVVKPIISIHAPLARRD